MITDVTRSSPAWFLPCAREQGITRICLLLYSCYKLNSNRKLQRRPPSNFLTLSVRIIVQGLLLWPGLEHVMSMDELGSWAFLSRPGVVGNVFPIIHSQKGTLRCCKWKRIEKVAFPSLNPASGIPENTWGARTLPVYIQPQSSSKYSVVEVVAFLCVCALIFFSSYLSFLKASRTWVHWNARYASSTGSWNSPLWAPCLAPVTGPWEGGGMGKVLEWRVVEKKDWITKEVIWRFLCLRKFSWVQM